MAGVSNLPEMRDRPATSTSPHHTTDGLHTTADLGLVFLFFIQESHEEIPDESRPKTPQLVFPFFVEVPNEEIQDDRRSAVAHNLSRQAVGNAVEHIQGRVFPNHRHRHICLNAARHQPMQMQKPPTKPASYHLFRLPLNQTDRLLDRTV